jgi:hypothetical protein
VGKGDSEIEVLGILVFSIFRWVRRSTLLLGVKINPAAGCIGKGEKEEES